MRRGGLGKTALSPERPPEWPEGVRAISMNGVALLGVHEKSGELFWDGRRVLIHRPFELGWVERIIAGLAAVATFGVFVIEFGRSAGWWAG
jgi:hypothetical protein